MYYSSWDKLYIYQLVEEDICMYAVGWMEFGPRTTMTGSCFKETFQHWNFWEKLVF